MWCTVRSPQRLAGIVALCVQLSRATSQERPRTCTGCSSSVSAQSCLILCDPMNCSPPGSSVHGILQARTLEWVAMSFSRGSSRPRDPTNVSCVSCIGRWILYHCTAWEAPAPWFSSPPAACGEKAPPSAPFGQFSSVTQLCSTLCDPMDCSTPGLPVQSPTPGVYPNSCPLSR